MNKDLVIEGVPMLSTDGKTQPGVTIRDKNGIFEGWEHTLIRRKRKNHRQAQFLTNDFWVGKTSLGLIAGVQLGVETWSSAWRGRAQEF